MENINRTAKRVVWAPAAGTALASALTSALPENNRVQTG